MSMPTRKIAGREVPEIGYGAMGLAAFYGAPKTQQECDKVFQHLIDNGCTFWDTSDIYSSNGSLGQNEEQIGSFFARNPGAREKVYIATKHNFTLSPDGSFGQVRGDREYTLSACEASLKRMGIDYIDLYYSHRPVEPVEEDVGAMKELKEQGKIKAIGVSEYSLEQLERANKIVHIDALQIELSPFTPNVVTNGILDWCKKNGTTLVAYSPIGRGFLSGQIKSIDDLEENDFRRSNERFQGENFKANFKLVDDIRAIAEKRGAKPAQIALAWVLAQDPCVIPIPGSTKPANISENLGAAKLDLSKDEIEKISSLIHAFETKGARYPPAMASLAAF